MKEPLRVTIRRADGTVEEGVMVGEVRREGGWVTQELDGAITLESGDSLTIDGFRVTTCEPG